LPQKSKPDFIKVLLIGNMNNNNFSIMRYLRDLGIDAHLFLMNNDYTKTLTYLPPKKKLRDLKRGILLSTI